MFLCLLVSLPFNKLDSPIIFPLGCCRFCLVCWGVLVNVMDVHWVGKEDEPDLVRMLIRALLCEWKFEGCSPFRSLEVFRCVSGGSTSVEDDPDLCRISFERYCEYGSLRGERRPDVWLCLSGCLD
ncbi:unnamed protein product [Camellia sinensis]